MRSQELEDQEEQSDWAPEGPQFVAFTRADKIALGLVGVGLCFVAVAEILGIRDIAVWLIHLPRTL